MQIETITPIAMDGLSGPGVFPAVTGRARPAPAVPEQPKQGPDAKPHDHSPDARQKAELADAMEPFNISLKFSTDDETGAIVVQMIDQKSGETLQQMPTAASLHVFASVRKLQGKIINLTA